MKKNLLLIFLAGIFTANAQTGRIKMNHSPKAISYLKTFTVDDAYAHAAAAYFNPEKNTPLPFALPVIGYTRYDYQTNASISRRIIAYADGTISFAWTTSGDNSPYNQRGTGWNYWNGTSLYNPNAIYRLEPAKTGYTNIGLLGNGKEVVMAHNPTPYDFQIGTNTTKGSGTWSFNNANATLPANQIPGYKSGNNNMSNWGKLATGGSNGNSIHLISNYFLNDNIIVKGINSPFVYSRSQDGGQTWDLKSVLLPGYDSTRTVQGQPDAYSIDAQDTVVAILHGGLGEDVTLWKSTNNGTTFMKTYVDSFPYAPSIDSTSTTDTVWTNDGTLSVVVDTTGKVHVAYAGVRVMKGGFFPADIDLVYWNDVTKQKVHIPIATADIDGAANGGNGNSTYDIGMGTLQFSFTDGSKCMYGNEALLNTPSIAVEGQNVYILFSLPHDADSTANGQSFRDVWIVASQDGGSTWGKIQNLTCTIGEEEYYASLAKHVDNINLHVLFEWDKEPGSIVANSDPAGLSELHYMAVSKAAVLAGTAGCSVTTGNNEQTTDAFTANNYPNPTNGITYFEVAMKQQGNIILSVYNNLGQTIYTATTNLSIGKHTISLDASSFVSGLYFYTIKSENSSVNGKFTKE